MITLFHINPQTVSRLIRPRPRGEGLLHERKRNLNYICLLAVSTEDMFALASISPAHDMDTVNKVLSDLEKLIIVNVDF